MNIDVEVAERCSTGSASSEAGASNSSSIRMALEGGELVGRGDYVLTFAVTLVCVPDEALRDEESVVEGLLVGWQRVEHRRPETLGDPGTGHAQLLLRAPVALPSAT